MNYTVYILFSLKDRRLYIGFTSTIEQRVRQHERGEVASTKDRRPLQLIYQEVYCDKGDALKRERYFKTTKGKVTLRAMLKNTLTNIAQNPNT